MPERHDDHVPLRPRQVYNLGHRIHKSKISAQFGWGVLRNSPFHAMYQQMVRSRFKPFHVTDHPSVYEVCEAIYNPSTAFISTIILIIHISIVGKFETVPPCLSGFLYRAKQFFAKFTLLIAREDLDISKLF